MFSSDYNVLCSTVIGLNNFIQYILCQVVQLFQLTPLLIKYDCGLHHNHTYTCRLALR